MITPDCLRCGDCLDVLRELKSGSMGLILCDPPYGTTKAKWDSVIELAPLWEQLKRVRAPGAAVVLMAGQPFTSVLIGSNLAEFKYTWVWDKITARGHLVAKKRPMAQHEDICVFGRGAVTYRPQMVARDKPMTCTEGSRSDLVGGDSWGYTATYTHKYPKTILTFRQDKNIGHPTQKPVALMEYLINTYTDPGAWVLDFAMGSGTTGIACRNTGRNFIGIEKDPTFFELARNRIFSSIPLDC